MTYKTFGREFTNLNEAQAYEAQVLAKQEREEKMRKLTPALVKATDEFEEELIRKITKFPKNSSRYYTYIFDNGIELILGRNCGLWYSSEEEALSGLSDAEKEFTIRALIYKNMKDIKATFEKLQKQLVVKVFDAQKKATSGLSDLLTDLDSLIKPDESGE